MRLIINDTSIFIDLRKADLLAAALLLPYRFQVALPLVHRELLDFTEADFEDLQARGLEVIDLSAAQVAAAIELRTSRPSMSIFDCFSIILAQTEDDAILLTGDQTQRPHAEALSVEVHGVLWVTDELERENVTTYQAILRGLLRLQADPVVFLPDGEVRRRIERLRGLLGDGDV